MAKMVKGQLQVTSADLDKFVKDHGWDKPLQPGEFSFTDRNGVTQVRNMADDLKKLDQIMKMFGGMK